MGGRCVQHERALLADIPQTLYRHGQPAGIHTETLNGSQPLVRVLIHRLYPIGFHAPSFRNARPLYSRVAFSYEPQHSASVCVGRLADDVAQHSSHLAHLATCHFGWPVYGYRFRLEKHHREHLLWCLADGRTIEGGRLD